MTLRKASEVLFWKVKLRVLRDATRISHGFIFASEYLCFAFSSLCQPYLFDIVFLPCWTFPHCMSCGYHHSLSDVAAVWYLFCCEVFLQYCFLSCIFFSIDTCIFRLIPPTSKRDIYSLFEQLFMLEGVGDQWLQITVPQHLEANRKVK